MDLSTCLCNGHFFPDLQIYNYHVRRRYHVQTKFVVMVRNQLTVCVPRPRRANMSPASLTPADTLRRHATVSGGYTLAWRAARYPQRQTRQPRQCHMRTMSMSTKSTIQLRLFSSPATTLPASHSYTLLARVSSSQFILFVLLFGGKINLIPHVTKITEKSRYVY